VTYTFPPNPPPAAKDTVPLTLTLRAEDTDTVSSSGYTEETAEIRSGRIKILNSYGSELVDLPMPMRVEYYTTDGWVANTADTCSSITLNATNFQRNLQSGETCVLEETPPNPPCGISGQGCAGLVTQCYRQFQSGGGYNLNLKAAGAANEGSVDVSADLSTKAWLRYDWDDNGSLDDPTGRATFGLYRGSPTHIYQRQRY
jgi:MSHA biogenesis protein MshQ